MIDPGPWRVMKGAGPVNPFRPSRGELRALVNSLTNRPTSHGRQYMRDCVFYLRATLNSNRNLQVC